jgi:hypothetical protein
VKNRILPIISFILLSLLLGGCQEKELITGRDKVFVGEAIQLIIDNRMKWTIYGQVAMKKSQ